MWKLSTTLAIVAAILVTVQGHGRLMTPPARSSMWRKGFQNVPIDFGDNGLFCGGATTQRQNGGKCGICGDSYTGAREHELGGKYYTDAIAGTYTSGQEFTAQVELTAAHKGWFEFKVCAPTDRTREVTQDCLDKSVLSLADGSGTRFKVTKSGANMFDIPLRLPAGLSCDYCVLQWRYHTGNSWGTDPDGTSCVGCGPQEEFYGCANIAITSSGTNPINPAPVNPGPNPVNPGPNPVNPGPNPVNPCPGPVNPNPTPAPATPAPATPAPATPAPWTPAPTPAPAPGPNECRASDGPYKNQPGIDGWCKTNCALGNCPPSHCVCGATKRQILEPQQADIN